MKVLLLATLFAMSTNVMAESDIKICGKLTFEKTMDRSLNGNKKNFTITLKNTLGWRFELAPYGREQEEYLKQIIIAAKVNSALEPVVCARGYFAGYFPHSGFSTGGETYSQGRTIPANKLQSFEYYKNFSR